MNPLLKALLEGLGLPETATTEQGVSALATLKSQAAQAGQIAGLTAQIATLKAATPDPTKFVTVEAVAALNTELATLRAQNAQVEIDQVLNQAKADGRWPATSSRRPGATSARLTWPSSKRWSTPRPPTLSWPASARPRAKSRARTLPN